MSENLSTQPLLDKDIQSIYYTKADNINQHSHLNSQLKETDIREQVLQPRGQIGNISNPIQRYNLVINEYNNDVNKVDGITLQNLNNSVLVNWFNKLFTRTISKWFLVLFFLLASGLNVLLFLLYLLTFIIYMMSYRVHKQNENKIPDPFQRMIYCEEICESLDANLYYFKLNIEEMNNFSFNFDTMQSIKERINGSMVEFMVYNIKFYENYTQFVKVKGRFIRWICASLFLIAVNAAIAFLIYDILIDKD